MREKPVPPRVHVEGVGYSFPDSPEGWALHQRIQHARRIHAVVVGVLCLAAVLILIL